MMTQRDFDAVAAAIRMLPLNLTSRTHVSVGLALSFETRYPETFNRARFFKECANHNIVADAEAVVPKRKGSSYDAL
jgi:hypothetical protein